MKTITITIKGDARVMFFGNKGWSMKDAGRLPECDKVFVGFTDIDAIEYEEQDVLGEMGSMLVPRSLEHVHSSYVGSEGWHLISYTDVESVELPVTICVGDDFEIPDLILTRDERKFEGQERLWMSNVFYLIENDDIKLTYGNFDEDVVKSILAHEEWYSDCYDKIYGGPEKYEHTSSYSNVIRSMTTVFAGEKSVAIPTAIAQKLKHFINKFRLQVRDVSLVEPWYMDEIQYQDYYKLTIVVEASVTLTKRRYRNIYHKMYSKIFKKYGWDIIIMIN